MLVARPGFAEAPTREAALGLIRALLTQKGALNKPNVVRPAPQALNCTSLKISMTCSAQCRHVR